jgi:ureidoglycolate hydrolase
MDENILEIQEYTGEGFKPLIYFGTWRVAYLRYKNELRPELITSMERHLETDEVFVLLNGHAVLVLGGNGTHIGDISAQMMEPGKLYNVRINVWHTVLMSRDVTILLVENGDTGEKNSDYEVLSSENCRQIIEMAQNEMPGMLS